MSGAVVEHLPANFDDGNGEGRKLGQGKGNRLAAHYQGFGARAFIGFSFCPLVCPIGVARFDVAPVVIDTHSPACVFRVKETYCFDNNICVTARQSYLHLRDFHEMI
jgi:hypothetical protein